MRELLAQELALVEGWNRLQAVYALDLGNGRLQARMDELSAHLAAAAGLPIAVITVLDQSAASFAGSYGVTGWLARVGAVPVELAPCVRVVTTAAPVVIGDLRADAVHRHNPLVTRCGLAAYAGAPILHASGQVLGAACVFGTQVLAFTAETLAAVAAAAADAGAALHEHAQHGRAAS
ncbi:GAF domain-containing protein [Kineococcus xinjiangensis]|uniref:GAF domain-containing protein n=1 Tax=Kineococcus xinjiangensis TaxID=512762 RepID=A0A2S6IHZ0_9ACTN|nr:GAF domain-containing protein [Kineococcus xinjiangensis]PPK93834.1 GAF domain-containing protein [Kineococcus xinjiangensis]